MRFERDAYLAKPHFAKSESALKESAKPYFAKAGLLNNTFT